MLRILCRRRVEAFGDITVVLARVPASTGAQGDPLVGHRGGVQHRPVPRLPLLSLEAVFSESVEQVADRRAHLPQRGAGDLHGVFLSSDVEPDESDLAVLITAELHLHWIGQQAAGHLKSRFKLTFVDDPFMERLARSARFARTLARLGRLGLDLEFEFVAAGRVGQEDSFRMSLQFWQTANTRDIVGAQLAFAANNLPLAGAHVNEEGP